MPHFKKCPHCKGKHRLQAAYNRCKQRHKMDSWPK